MVQRAAAGTIEKKKHPTVDGGGCVTNENVVTPVHGTHNLSEVIVRLNKEITLLKESNRCLEEKIQVTIDLHLLYCTFINKLYC